MGVGDPKVCVPKMARSDFPHRKFRCFPRWSLWSAGGGGGGRESLEGGGGVTPSPPPHCPDSTREAFPYPNPSPNRISNRQ